MPTLRPAQIPPPLPTARRWPVSPVLVSALVYPGVGQLMQRRWLAAGIALAAFTGAAGWFFVRTGKVLIDYYRMGFDFADAPERPIQLREIVLPFVIALVVYLICVVDTAVADFRLRRRASASAERRFS